MKNRILTTCLSALCFAASSIMHAENDKPFVIPELREWQGAEGTTAISAKSPVL